MTHDTPLLTPLAAAFAPAPAEGDRVRQEALGRFELDTNA